MAADVHKLKSKATMTSRLLLSSSSKCLSCSVFSVCNTQVRWKHSSTQVKRLFKNHPARARVESRMGVNHSPPQALEPPTYSPLSEEIKILYNGWSQPIENVEIPDYPFQVRRTKNKPNDAVGFLPVYAKFRYAKNANNEFHL